MLTKSIYRAKYIFAKHLPLQVPVDVSLELSSLCNMKCAYCYHAEGNVTGFDKKFMSLETAEEIISQAHELRVNSIKFNYRGESTMNPHFAEIVSYANSLAGREIFIDRILNTNMKIPAIRQKKCFDAMMGLTKVKVSFDSFRKQVFETQRAGGNWDLTFKNLEAFYDRLEREGKGPQLVIQAVRTKLNADEDIAGIASAMFPKAEISIRDMVTGRVDADLEHLEKKKRTVERQSCIQAHARLIFAHDGSAQFCCPDLNSKLSRHNIHHTSMFEIFNSDFAKDLRASLKNGSAFMKDPCKSCPSHESMKGYKHPWKS